MFNCGDLFVFNSGDLFVLNSGDLFVLNSGDLFVFNRGDLYVFNSGDLFVFNSDNFVYFIHHFMFKISTFGFHKYMYTQLHHLKCIPSFILFYDHVTEPNPHTLVQDRLKLFHSIS